MSSPSYIRFRLRLPAPGRPAPPPADGDAPLRVDPGEGGVAAFGTPRAAAVAGDDRSAVSGDDTCAAAVRLLAGLPLPGWQEEEEGDDRCLVFWLPAACAADESVEKTIVALSALGGLTATPESSQWETRWRDFHHPVRVGRVLVRPPWATPDPELLDVVIDVGMAFGTGGHATTRQCLDLLQHVRPGRLLDVGCGSGVLSIAAVRLGFAPVEAIDIDELAVTAAAANALLNGVRLDLRCADATAGDRRSVAADVIVANVALGPVVALGGLLGTSPRSKVPAEGPDRAPAAAAGPPPASPPLPRDVILAGLLGYQIPEALAAWPAYAVVTRLDEGEWAALHLRLRRSPVATSSDQPEAGR